MFTFAVITALLCAAVPVLTLARMWITARQVRADIHARMSAYRHTYRRHLRP